MFVLYCSEKSDLFVLFPEFYFSYCTVSTVYIFEITYKCVLLMLHCKKQLEPINKYKMNTYGNINRRDNQRKGCKQSEKGQVLRHRDKNKHTQHLTKHAKQHDLANIRQYLFGFIYLLFIKMISPSTVRYRLNTVNGLVGGLPSIPLQQTPYLLNMFL